MLVVYIWKNVKNIAELRMRGSSPIEVSKQQVARITGNEGLIPFRSYIVEMSAERVYIFEMGRK